MRTLYRWKDDQYVIGQLSRNVRKLRIVNVLTQQSDVLNVCGEETMEEISTEYADGVAERLRVKCRRVRVGLDNKEGAGN